MPVFISDEELRRGDVGTVVARAEEHIRKLGLEIETHKARSDAAVINVEQTATLLEQKYLAVLDQVSLLEGDKAQLALSLETKSSQLAQAQAQAHQLELQLMQRDGNLESQSLEIKELHKGRKEMLDVIEKKNLELDEKNAASRSYLERVLALTEERSNLESRIHEQMSEVTRLRASEARLTQEKDITSQHNSWLNQELQIKVSNLLEERQRNAQVEADLQARVMEAERTSKEKDEALTRSQDRVKDLETELRGMIEELRFVKEDAATKEEHLSTEVATASKLADLYKKSSEEWSRKVNDLEGVIKALEVHLKQSADEHDEKLRKGLETRQAMEQEFAEAKASFEKKIAELQQAKSFDTGLLQLESLPLAARENGAPSGNQESALALPKFPYEVSGTALAAALLRDGWSLGTVYGKYQEAVDAWRHEMQERNRAQALLEKVLREIENRATKIMEERAEYTRMLDSYVIMEEKLKHSMSDQAQLENSVRDSQAELRKKDRELKGALKDVSDLQTQVSVLVKECMDIQKRHGVGGESIGEVLDASPVPDETSADAIISDKLLSFKDIHGLVEHNTQLRALVRVLAEENERKEKEMKDEFESRLRLRIEEAAEKVNVVLRRAEEQNSIIERLQGTVGMYKRLYEDERLRSSSAVAPGTPPDVADRDSRRLWEISQEDLNRQLSNASQQIKALEDQLSQSRHDLASARAASARADAEAAFAKEKLSSLTRDSENQRKQMELIVSKNVEASQTITDYQRRLREGYQNVQSAEEQARRLSIEVSVLEREKDLLRNAEQRAAAEASQLSDRVHRLQATLDTIETTAEVREVARVEERRKLEEDVNRMQKEWVDAKHQLELERNFVRNITGERDKAIERIESLNQELKGALAALSASELRTKVAEVRCGELETSLKRADEKILAVLAGGKKVLGSEDKDSEMLSALQQSREEIEALREEVKASKMHAEQYKHIANANEEALKRLEETHTKFREEAGKTKDALDSELKLLQSHLSAVESLSLEKEKETGVQEANREALLRETLKEVSALRESQAAKEAALQQAENRIAALREDLDKQHKQWRQAQNNYERQVMLQAETLQELTLVNERVATLEQEGIQLRGKAEKAEADLESVKVAFFMEKSAFEAANADLEKRYKDLDAQNCLLLDRLEAKHITVAEQERRASTSDSKEDSELQNVIQYLRRAKEAAETEISLLRQERTRLNKQFEAASRAAEEAQEKLRHHHESMRASLYTDEEFQALQTKVMELNVLRDKNSEYREENKKITESNKELLEQLTKLEEEHETMKRSLKQKDTELEANTGEIESLKSENTRWRARLTQMAEKYKALDVDDYEKLKASSAETQERNKRLEKELEIARRDAAEYREAAMKHEQEATMRAENVAQLEKRLQESLSSEAANKLEAEKFRKILMQSKRKLELMTKEKEAVSKELDDHKTGKSYITEAAHHDALEACQKEASVRLEERSEQAQKDMARFEQVQRESDQRMKSLEKILEKEREEVKKEKLKRERDQKLSFDALSKLNIELKSMKTEIDQYRQVYGTLGNEPAKGDPENGSKAGDEPMADVATTSGATEQAPEAAPVAPPAAPPAAPAAAAPKPPLPSSVKTPPARTSSSTDPAEKEREIQELRATIVEKELRAEKEKSQTRRSGRRLVRPRLSNQAEAAAETGEPAGEMATEGPAEGEAEAKAAEIADAPENTAAHKRSSSETMDGGDQAAVPPQKKARGSDAAPVQETPAPETSEAPQPDVEIAVEDEQKQVEAAVENEIAPRPEQEVEAGAGEAMEDVIQVEDAPEGDVVEQEMQVDEMQPEQTEGAITDIDELVDVEDGEIEELDMEQQGEGEGEEQKRGEEGGAEQQKQEAVIEEQAASPAPEVQAEDPVPEDAPTGNVEAEKTPVPVEKAPPVETSPASASASASTSTPVAAAPTSTTINLTDRARERAAQRRNLYQSPPSPRARTRGRPVRNRGRGGGRA